LIEPLWSRCSVVDFVIPKEQRSKMAAAFFKRVKDILTTEGVEYDSKAVVSVIEKHFPDWRRVLNELQRYSATGRIDTGILSNLQEETFKTLVGYLKNKEFTNVRKWVAENADVDQHVFFRKFYDSSYEFMNSSSVAQLVLLLSKYQYQAAFVADQDINMAACLTEVMVECEFK
jgi:DNA polymerase III delta prime subunit